MKKFRVSRGIILFVSVLLLLTSLSIFSIQIFKTAKKTQADVSQLQIGGSNATNSFTGNLLLPGDSKWTSDGKLSVGTGATVANSNLNVSGGAAFGSGNALIDSNGKIAAISSTQFANLSGANLTALNASNLSSGTVAVARGGTGAADAATARTNLDVPSRAGSGASGTWGIGISGNAATVTNGMYLGSADTVTGKKIFVGDANKLNNDSTATLELKSSGAPAVGLSFHRPGYFASKLVLDSDNVFHFGGWSNTADGATVKAATFVGALSGNASSATSATNLSGVWGLYANNRPRVYDIGCGSGWASSCDPGQSGWPDYADSAGAAYPYRVGGVVMQFNWSGQGGQPTWLWGGADGTNFYVYNPSNFNVNYATYAGSANTWTPQVSTWYGSSDGKQRFHFGSNSHTYIKSPSNIYFRTGNLDSEKMWLDTGGNLYMVGTCFDGTSTPCATDVAEFYSATEDIDKGDIVTADGWKQVKKSSIPYDTGIIGMRSTRPAIAISDQNISLGQNIEAKQNIADKPLVALVGRVPLKVATFNGKPSVGDIITSSYLPGVGMKATKAGATVGKTVESFDHKYSDTTCKSVSSYSDIKWSDDIEQYHECYKVPTSSLPSDIQQNLRKDGFNGDAFYVGKVMTFVNVSWYDPDVYLTSTGDISVVVNEAGKTEVKTKGGTFISRVGAFAEAVIGKLRVGVLEVKKLVVNGVDIVEKLNKLSATVEQQQKTIEALKKEVEALKK